MNATVLDILIYVFDRYMLGDAAEVPEREHLVRDLERAGFAHAKVERALDWLADLANERDRPPLAAQDERGGIDAPVRVFTESELARLSTECRGFVITLERLGILSPQQREIVIERMLALDVEEVDAEQLKWVVLMVLSSQPGQELAFERLEDLVGDGGGAGPH